VFRRSVRRSPEDFVNANGLRLCYQTFGEQNRPAMVLIMGMGAQMVGWDDDFCELLAGRGFWVIRFDNRDAGRSTHLDWAGKPDVASALTRAYFRLPVAAPYRLEDMALDVVCLLDALEIKKAHIVGASMGGAIAQIMAFRFPERVLSLTSIMSTTGNPNLPQPVPSVVSTVLKPPPPTHQAYIEYYVQTWTELRVISFPEDEERDRLRAARNFARGLYPLGGSRHLVAILASGSRKQALRNITAPTLVIHGDVDRLVPLAGGIDTAESIRDARLMVLKGMGHALPGRMWSHMIDGIAEVAERAKHPVWAR
jgi:pimeloyl-ACP methyl ester carboxylesterase